VSIRAIVRVTVTCEHQGDIVRVMTCEHQGDSQGRDL
jgi:hypothetical protein